MLNFYAICCNVYSSGSLLYYIIKFKLLYFWWIIIDVMPRKRLKKSGMIRQYENFIISARKEIRAKISKVLIKKQTNKKTQWIFLI